MAKPVVKKEATVEIILPSSGLIYKYRADFHDGEFFLYGDELGLETENGPFSVHSGLEMEVEHDVKVVPVRVKIEVAYL